MKFLESRTRAVVGTVMAWLIFADAIALPQPQAEGQPPGTVPFVLVPSSASSTEGNPLPTQPVIRTFTGTYIFSTRPQPTAGSGDSPQTLTSVSLTQGVIPSPATPTDPLPAGDIVQYDDYEPKTNTNNDNSAASHLQANKDDAPKASTGPQLWEILDLAFRIYNQTKNS